MFESSMTNFLGWPGMWIARRLPASAKWWLAIFLSSVPTLCMVAMINHGLINAQQQTQLWIISASVCLLTAYLQMCLAWANSSAIRVLQGSAIHLASGDFSSPICLRATDELNTVARTLDSMNDHLSLTYGI